MHKKFPYNCARHLQAVLSLDRNSCATEVRQHGVCFLRREEGTRAMQQLEFFRPGGPKSVRYSSMDKASESLGNRSCVGCGGPQIQASYVLRVCSRAAHRRSRKGLIVTGAKTRQTQAHSLDRIMKSRRAETKTTNQSKRSQNGIYWLHNVLQTYNKSTWIAYSNPSNGNRTGMYGKTHTDLQSEL